MDQATNIQGLHDVHNEKAICCPTCKAGLFDHGDDIEQAFEISKPQPPKNAKTQYGENIIQLRHRRCPFPNPKKLNLCLGCTATTSQNPSKLKCKCTTEVEAVAASGKTVSGTQLEQAPCGTPPF